MNLRGGVWETVTLEIAHLTSLTVRMDYVCTFCGLVAGLGMFMNISTLTPHHTAVWMNREEENISYGTSRASWSAVPQSQRPLGL